MYKKLNFFKLKNIVKYFIHFI